VCLIASGGHTLLAHVTDRAGYELLGQTLDDAAGEAFDKGARLLGLGYPGGPALSRLAAQGDRSAFDFPTAARVTGLDFSFAGLKTALLYKTRELGPEETERRAADLAASYEHAIVQTLMARVERALAAAGAVHRQRGDDRVGRPLRRAGRVPRLPGCRRLRSRCIAARAATSATRPALRSTAYVPEPRSRCARSTFRLTIPCTGATSSASRW
jgi:hypothetical protein